MHYYIRELLLSKVISRIINNKDSWHQPLQRLQLHYINAKNRIKEGLWIRRKVRPKKVYISENRKLKKES